MFVLDGTILSNVSSITSVDNAAWPALVPRDTLGRGVYFRFNSDQEKSPKRQLKLISVTKDGKTSCTAVRNAAKSNSSASTSGISSKSNTATDSGSSSSGEREEINGTDKQVLDSTSDVFLKAQT